MQAAQVMVAAKQVRCVPGCGPHTTQAGDPVAPNLPGATVVRKSTSAAWLTARFPSCRYQTADCAVCRNFLWNWSAGAQMVCSASQPNFALLQMRH